MKVLTWKGMKFEAYRAEKEYQQEERAVIRIVYNGEPLLWGWTRGYDAPRGLSSNKLLINPLMAVYAFEQLGIVNGCSQEQKPEENKQQEAPASSIQELQLQVLLKHGDNPDIIKIIQAQMGLNTVQAQPIQQKEHKELTFNFDVECEEDEEVFYETIVEEVVEVKPKRRASNRD